MDTWAKRFEQANKRLLRQSLRWACPKLAPISEPLNIASVKRILVVRQDSRLGNLLLLTPLLRGLRLVFPHSKIDVLLSDAYGDVLKHNPCVDELLVLPKKVFLPNPILPIKLFISLRRRAYDLAFDASHMHAFSLSSAIITAFSGARRRIGYDRGEANRFLNNVAPIPIKPHHETEILLGLLRHVSPPAVLPIESELRLEYFPTAAEKDKASQLLQSWGTNKETVAIFMGARESKRWPVESILELSERLFAKGHPCILFGGPAEKKIMAGLRLSKGTILAPQLPLRIFAAVIAGVRAVISADTGPMHLAVAVGAPTVEIFMNSEPWRFSYAYLPNHRVVDSGGRLATVDEVFAAFLSLASSFKN